MDRATPAALIALAAASSRMAPKQYLEWLAAEVDRVVDSESRSKAWDESIAKVQSAAIALKTGVDCLFSADNVKRPSLPTGFAEYAGVSFECTYEVEPGDEIGDPGAVYIVDVLVNGAWVPDCELFSDSAIGEMNKSLLAWLEAGRGE